ncbi:MAG: F0F1 ATP synthase subunit A [Microgenomates group bacterium]|nr:F0F1 ATP synthase subunit A [Microgenomates group bacterium]
MPTISIKAESVFKFFHLEITNSYLLSLIVIAIFLMMALKYYQDSQLEKKSNFYIFFQMINKSLYSLFASVVGDKINNFFPLLAAFFLYILFQNWFGLMPGVGSLLIKEDHHFVPLLRSNNADLNTTIALGIVSVLMIQYYGIKYLGFGNYIKKFINLSNPINFVLGLLEIVSEFSKIISFSFRLFGNIFAGEVLLTIVAFLVPVLAAFPFLILEIFVGFIQALVFSMLTAVFLSGAVQSHH